MGLWSQLSLSSRLTSSPRRSAARHSQLETIDRSLGLASERRGGVDEGRREGGKEGPASLDESTVLTKGREGTLARGRWRRIRRRWRSVSYIFMQGVSE